MKTNLFCTFILTSLFTITWSNNTYANNEYFNKSNVSAYILSESFSNILPIKQLIKDEWKQAPSSGSNIGFTQNELGLKAYWGNVSFNIAHRLDYFVFTNPDTAQAFYLERTDQPLTTQDSYQLSLKLHHQRSNGFRLGYQWQLDNFSAEVNIGYWDVSTSRESRVTGKIFSDENNNIAGAIELNEHFSNKNFLNGNINRKSDGYGITLDLAINWKVTNNLNIDIDIKDLYSTFSMTNLNFRQGGINTNGTYIHILGKEEALRHYTGVLGTKDFNYNLPEHVSLVARYQADNLTGEDFTVGYLTRYKRQGEVNFYYAGVEFSIETNKLIFMLDLEHFSPEIRYQNKWLDVIFATDEFNLNKAMQFTLGVSVNYAF